MVVLVLEYKVDNSKVVDKDMKKPDVKHYILVLCRKSGLKRKKIVNCKIEWWVM